jgi:dipeptidyl aminopeptidase/acylaminoacyl peptidase
LAAKKIRPYGTWTSPITDSVLTSSAGVPTELTTDGHNLYWLQSQPENGGRYALYFWKIGSDVRELVPAEFNVRTRVHEYGGGSYLASESTIYFSNFRDQLVYALNGKSEPVPITREGLRYADYVMDKTRNRLIGVREDHTGKGRLPQNTIATIACDGGTSEVLLAGNDFYASPRIDPSGSKIAWITWNFPNMPWDGTELWTARLASDGSFSDPKLIAGGKSKSVIMPSWSPEGALHFVSDATGFWNIYRYNGKKIEPLCPLEVDMGVPHWVFRISTYDFLSEDSIACAYTMKGIWHLGIINPKRKKLKKIPTRFTDIGYVRALDGKIYFVGGSPTQPVSVIQLDPMSGHTRVVYAPKVARVGEGYLSVPRHIEFATSGGKRAFAFYYEPKNKDFTAPKGERPPLIVISHGGPTGQTRSSLNLGIQAWTSRGFAALDVNYGGSTGYGRNYRERLRGKWGIVDVEDCSNGALALAKRGLVDHKRLAIRGGSAGGYTTLCALAFKKTFGAGASYFGVSDAEALAKHTHKFESRYLDKLIAPYPEGKEVYRKRSALYAADKITSPVIFFQGLEDVIVPPSQAETMVESLRKRGVPVAYLPFEGEQHGFRRAETIKRAFGAELYFYSRVFGFNLPESIEPVEIWNSSSLASSRSF